MMSAIGDMINNTVKCVKCGAGMGECDCWTKCKCGWLFEKDSKCNNPKCGGGPNRPLTAIFTGSGKLK